MAKNKPSIIAVCDSGPIIHLDELDSLSLLADFRLMVPHAVREEIHHHRPTALSWIQKNSQKGIVPERVPHNLLVISSALSLDKGEMEALCLMINRPDSLLLTDDAAARLAAQQLGYSVHGTIGILIRAVRQNQLTALEVIKRLHSIPDQSSVFIRSSLLDEILYQLEEEFNLR